MIEKDSEVFLYVVAHLDLDRLPPHLISKFVGETGYAAPSIALYYISLLSGLGNIFDQNRNPNINNREHLVGRPTMPHPAMKKIFKTAK